MKENTIKPASKWCPMARLAIEHSACSANRFDGRDPGATENYSRVRCMTTVCAVFVGDDATGRCGLIRG